MNYRTDIAIDFNKQYMVLIKKKNIELLESKINKYLYHTIRFKRINKDFINILKKELLHFIKLSRTYKDILVVGLGNESNTADSIGPKTIKKIKVNFNINEIKNINSVKVSALIPGVLGITGIETNKIIKSVIKTIKPNLIILIDSLVTNNINSINKTLEISNKSLSPGSGIYGNNKKLNTNIPIISIGIPTSLEYIHNDMPFLLSPSNIDNYINEITSILGNTLNDIFYNELNDTPL